MIRFLIYITIIWLVVQFIKGWLESPPNPNRSQKPKQVEKFVSCHKCGLHIPYQEAIKAHGNYYCSESHRDNDSH